MASTDVANVSPLADLTDRELLERIAIQNDQMIAIVSSVFDRFSDTVEGLTKNPTAAAMLRSFGIEL